MKVFILIAPFYQEITQALLEGAQATLSDANINDVTVLSVDGAYELPQLANKLCESQNPDGILCLGCIIRGETPHFDIVANESARGLMNVSLKHSIPVTNGVLTTDTRDQADSRAGGKKGNKGAECAQTLLGMLKLFNEY